MVPLSIFFLRTVQLFFIYSFKLLFQKSKSKTDLQKLKTNYFILYVSLQVALKPICTLCFQNSSICELVLSNASCDGKIKTDANNCSRKQSKLTWFRVRLFQVVIVEHCSVHTLLCYEALMQKTITQRCQNFFECSCSIRRCVI